MTNYLPASVVKVTIKPPVVPVLFIRGRPFELTCTVHTDKDLAVTWTKNESPLEADEYQITSFAGADAEGPTKNVRLTKNVSGESDIASFRCSAGDVDQFIQTSSFYVFVRDSNITEGADTTLTCKPELEYVNKFVTWFKGEVPLEEIPELKGRLEFDNDTVTFRNAKLTDSGVYKCRLEIGPSKEISQVFVENVVLHGKPYITNVNAPELNQRITNSSITLKCPAGGYPAPEVFWFRGMDVLEPSDRILVTSLNGQASGQLEIINSTEADFGQYSCTAENALGKATLTFQLKDPALANSGFKPGLGDLHACGVFLYISIVAIAASWTR